MRDLSYKKTALGPDLDEFLAWLENERGSRPKTIDSYARQIAHLCLRLPHKWRGDFTKKDMRDELNCFPAGSRRKSQAVLNSFWNFMVGEGYVAASPMVGISAPKRRSPAVYDVFTEAEERQLIDQGPEQRYGFGIEARDRIGVLLLLRCGLRVGELRHLQVRHVDLDNRWLIVNGKGDKTRVVPYRGEVETAMREFMLTALPRMHRPPIATDHLLYGARVTGSSILVNRDAQVLSVTPDTPIVESTVWRWWKACVERAGVRYRNPHMTRHTYATNFLRANRRDLKALQDALGHAELSSTQVYLHTEVSDVEEAVDRLEAWRAEQPADLRARRQRKEQA